MGYNCEFDISEDHLTFVCKRCGKKVILKRPADHLVVTCDKPDGWSFPPIADQIKNAATAAVEFAADGFRLASSEEQERRLAICEACTDRHGDRCGKCGCYTPLKTLGRVFRCPEGKW